MSTSALASLTQDSLLREVIREARPNLYLLHSAAWRLGLTVNGIKAR